MKSSKGFIIGITVFIIMMFLIQLNMPKRFSWNPTFAHNDKNPFGSYVFDDIMKQSMPDGYETTRKTLYQISKEQSNRNILVVTDNFSPNAVGVKTMMNMARRGCKIMIAGKGGTTTGDSLLTDSIGMVFYGYDNFSIDVLRQEIENDFSKTRETICWHNTDSRFGANAYQTYSMMTGCHVRIHNSSGQFFDTLATCSKHQEPVAVRRRIGSGEIIMVSTPLLITNYGVLDSCTTGYVFRLMTLIANRPVTRTTAYMKTADEEAADSSPLRVFLNRPPLRAALYMTLAVIALLMVQTARRRQRIIPIVKPPENRSLEFIQLIGTLYYQRKDHSDIVRKKFALFAEELRRMLLVDVTDQSNDAHTFGVISWRTV